VAGELEADAAGDGAFWWNGWRHEAGAELLAGGLGGGFGKLKGPLMPLGKDGFGVPAGENLPSPGGAGRAEDDSERADFRRRGMRMGFHGYVRGGRVAPHWNRVFMRIWGAHMLVFLFISSFFVIF